jgi:hypothetical protein
MLGSWYSDSLRILAPLLVIAPAKKTMSEPASVSLPWFPLIGNAGSTDGITP